MREVGLSGLKWILNSIQKEHLTSLQNNTKYFGLPKFAGKKLYNIQNYQNIKIGNIDAELIVPSNARRKSLMVYWHGGAYITGNASMYRALTSRFAECNRISVLVPNYHLAPNSTFPSQILETLETYAYVQKHFKPQNIIVAGDSAGGNLSLASLLAVSNPDLFRNELEKFSAPDCALDEETKAFFKESIKKYEIMERAEYSTFKGCVCLSPWLDLSHETRTLVDYVTSAKDPFLPADKVDLVVRSFLSLHPDPQVPSTLRSSPLVSPGLASKEDKERLPRTLIHAGEADMLIYDMFKFATNCDQIQLRTFPGHPHVFQLFPKLIFPDVLLSHKEITQFIDSLLLNDQ